MSYSITVHLAEVGIQDVLSALPRFCGWPFTRNGDAELESWTTSGFGMDIAVYESADFEDDGGIPFSQYSVVISLSSSHSSELQKQFMQLAAILIARTVGDSCSAHWIVVVEMAKVIAQSE